MTIIDSRAWELFLRKFPNHHFLQSSQWGDLKADFGWNVFRVISSTAGSQVLFRKIPLGYTIGYIAKGPVGNNWNSLWPEIDKLCRNQKAIYLLIEFDYFDSQAPIDYEKLADFIETSDSIQPRRTIIIDINKPENEILQNMRQKTRYNINLAVKKEIKIIRTNDISIFDSLMKQTGHRDHFSVHNFAYYSSVYSKFNPTGNCELFLATFENKPLAAIMVFL